MTFPDEGYVFSNMKDYIFIGAYDGEECVGLAVLTSAFSPCLFLYDLKVKKSMRRNGIGRMLIDASITYALNKNYKVDWQAGIGGGQFPTKADCRFVVTTKRPERIKACVPSDWGDGWEHVYISISIENQEMADIRLKLHN